MGFDDEVWDSQLLETTREMCKEFIGSYGYEDWDDLEGMETGDKIYNGYSLCYRMTLQIRNVFMAGANPYAPTELQVKKNNLETRKETLQLAGSVLKKGDDKRRIIGLIGETDKAIKDVEDQIIAELERKKKEREAEQERKKKERARSPDVFHWGCRV